MAILTGGIQWFSSTATSNFGGFGPKQMEIQKSGITPPSSINRNSGNTSNIGQVPPDGDFRDGKFHGKDGHGGAGSPFLVKLTYFAIWAAIIIPIYYLENRILINKRKVRSVVTPQNS